MSAPRQQSVHWIIQANRGAALDVNAMAETLRSDGHFAHLVTLERGAPVPEIPLLPDAAPIVCHGPGFMTRALGHPRLGSGLFFDRDTFRWSTFQAHWDGAMLAEDGRLTTLSAVRSILVDGSSTFVRPDADNKAFDGGVYDSLSLERATEHLGPDAELPVIMAAPRTIEAEWRFFIVDKEVAGCSEYRRWGVPSTDGAVPHRAIDLVVELAQKWGPSAVYCVDLATTDGRIGVVEANCFNASRFYSADGNRILRAVNAFKLSQPAS